MHLDADMVELDGLLDETGTQDVRTMVLAVVVGVREGSPASLSSCIVSARDHDHARRDPTFDIVQYRDVWPTGCPVLDHRAHLDICG